MQDIWDAVSKSLLLLFLGLPYYFFAEGLSFIPLRSSASSELILSSSAVICGHYSISPRESSFSCFFFSGAAFFVGYKSSGVSITWSFLSCDPSSLNVGLWRPKTWEQSSWEIDLPAAMVLLYSALRLVVSADFCYRPSICSSDLASILAVAQPLFLSSFLSCLVSTTIFLFSSIYFCYLCSFSLCFSFSYSSWIFATLISFMTFLEISPIGS